MKKKEYGSILIHILFYNLCDIIIELNKIREEEEYPMETTISNISLSELIFIIFDIGIIFIILSYIIYRISFNLRKKHLRNRVETSIKANKEQELVEEDGTAKKMTPINQPKLGPPENFRVCCNCSKELNTTDDHNYQMALDDYGIKYLCARCSYTGVHFKFFLDQLDKIVCLPQKDEINK